MTKDNESLGMEQGQRVCYKNYPEEGFVLHADLFKKMMKGKIEPVKAVCVWWPNDSDGITLEAVESLTAASQGQERLPLTDSCHKISGQLTPSLGLVCSPSNLVSSQMATEHLV